MQLPKNQQEWILFSLFCSFAFFAALQVWYYLWFFSRLAFHKNKQGPISTPPASVLICARNEATNLEENLPLIMTQDYPDFEVVVINDCSWDDTELVLKNLAGRYPNLKIITIKQDDSFSHGKKVAVMVGIKGAKHEHLLFTDADCKPQSDQWLRQMMKPFDQDCDIVLGYGAYQKESGFLNRLIRFDTFTIALMFLSMAMARRPYMGVGRNLAYKRTLFFKNKGFASHYYIASGDDDLFINEAATRDNTVSVIAPEGFTLSVPKRSLRDWVRQKGRHATTFSHYKMGTRLRLLLFGLSQYLFYLLFLPLVVLWYEPIIVLSIFGFKQLVQLIIFSRSMEKLKEKDLLWLFPFLEFSLMCLYPVISINNRF